MPYYPFSPSLPLSLPLFFVDPVDIVSFMSSPNCSLLCPSVLSQFQSCLLVDFFFVHIFFSILKRVLAVYRLHAHGYSKRLFLLKKGWIFLTYRLQTDWSPCWRKAVVFFLFCHSRLGSELAAH